MPVFAQYDSPVVEGGHETGGEGGSRLSMDGIIPDINNSQELWGVDPAVTIVVVIKIEWHLDS